MFKVDLENPGFEGRTHAGAKEVRLELREYDWRSWGKCTRCEQGVIGRHGSGRMHERMKSVSENTKEATPEEVRLAENLKELTSNRIIASA